VLERIRQHDAGGAHAAMPGLPQETRNDIERVLSPAGGSARSTSELNRTRSPADG
jgi:hypothetical protein